MKPVQNRGTEAGQALLLVIVSMGIFLLAALGLAVDGSHLYAQRQMAQAAADAAAQAGIMSIFDGTNGSGTYAFSTGSSFTCAASDTRLPCYYAQVINGFNSGADTVAVDFPTTGDAAVGVTVSRNVGTTLMRFVGPSTATISARAIAAIEDISAAIPIIVTHTNLPGSLEVNGTPNITIIGGPRRSIEVNSSDAGSIRCSGTPTVDLSHAGPDRNGADFGDLGGPGSPCFNYNFGVGTYVQPASPVSDPLSGVPVPTTTGLTSRPDPPVSTVPIGTNGCIAPVGCNHSCPTSCPLYQPGLYSAGISVRNSNTAGVSLFAPGLYYISAGGFNMRSNSAAQMATGMAADPLHPEIGTAGMVVFNSGTGRDDIINFDSNAGSSSPITLQGAPGASVWQGMLFFEDPTSAGGSHTGLPSGNPAHQIWGSGTVTLTGTIYINRRGGVTGTVFQSLGLGGGGGSTTTVTGEIIVNTLSLGGNGQINMNLDSAARIVKQVALIH